MKRASLPIERMAIWAKLAGIEMNNIEIVLTENCGNGITSTVDMTNDTTHDLISVPPSLILNKESVWEHARADKDLRTILEANKELASTERGAILLFLWIQFATTSADMPFKVGVQHPWTTYVQFLSDETSLPTFWTSEELEMFWGTSLASVMAGKLFALEAEFEDFKTSLGGTKLHKAWFDPDTGCASLHDWKVIDGMYRSRCMHLEGYGSCMVPIMDMANHARHTNAVASYSADPSSKKARLGFELEYLAAGSQITIPYYSYKGACESLFSYGFFEHDLDNARSLYLSIKAPEDDPLAEAKIAALDLKPGLQIIMNNTAENVHWGSPLVWAMSVNEEDGLEILKVMTVHGEEELVVKWKGLVISDAEELAARIKDASLRDIYKLRAHTLVQTRIEDEIQARYREKMMREQTGADDEFDKDSYLWEVAELLRWLETELLKIAATCSQATVRHHMSSRVVEKYLNGVSLADLDSQNSPGSDDWELEIPMNKSWRSNESEGEDVKVGYFEAPTGSEDPWKDAVAATDNNFDEDDATHRRIATVKELEESSENVPEMKAHFPETSDQDLGTDSGTTGAKFVEPAPSSDDDFS